MPRASFDSLFDESIAETILDMHDFMPNFGGWESSCPQICRSRAVDQRSTYHKTSRRHA